MNIYREEIVRAARKEHTCVGCLTKINVGDAYLRVTSQYEDGTPVSDPYHQDCRGWEVFLCQESDLNCDEWSLLHEHVSQGGRGVLDGAPPEVIARFPVDDES
jgi:hypothetical protein